MKNTPLLLMGLLISSLSYGQASGNVNYHSGNVAYGQTLPLSIANTLNLAFSNTNDLVIEVNGLSNIKADAYVAIFHVTQVGKSIIEVNDLLNERIGSVNKSIAEDHPNTELFVDMVSFVPIYEYELEKKLFSKNTYNEIPKGFELKKNLHIRYTDPNQLDKLITICTKSEIFDLVRVEYICTNLEQKKRELAAKAVEIVKEKIIRFSDLLSINTDDLYKQMVEAYHVSYPIEQYQSYQAFSSTSLDLKKAANVNNTAKSYTTYYKSITDKEFDFVMNPVVVEPVIQVIYQIKLKISNPKKPVVVEKAKKEYWLVTPNGDLRNIPTN